MLCESTSCRGEGLLALADVLCFALNDRLHDTECRQAWRCHRWQLSAAVAPVPHLCLPPSLQLLHHHLCNGHLHAQPLPWLSDVSRDPGGYLACRWSSCHSQSPSCCSRRTPTRLPLACPSARSPQINPELEGPTLPSKSDEEFRPFVRRLPEFKFWCGLGGWSVSRFEHPAPAAVVAARVHNAQAGQAPDDCCSACGYQQPGLPARRGVPCPAGGTAPRRCWLGLWPRSSRCSTSPSTGPSSCSTGELQPGLAPRRGNLPPCVGSALLCVSRAGAGSC